MVFGHLPNLSEMKESLKFAGYLNVLVPVVAALLAFTVSRVEPAFDALFLALIFGIFISFFYDEEKKRVIERSLSISLPIGITLYGANIDFRNLQIFPADIVIVTLFLAFFMGFVIMMLARIMRIRKTLAILLACGTSLCGASAISILAPILKPKKQEFSAAIMIISVVGLTGAMLYPTIGYLLNLPPKEFALLSGSTLHQTGLVKIASRPLGSEVMAEALAVKGIRIAMIAVVALIVSFMYSENRFYVPWYIATFLAVAMLSGMHLPENVTQILKPLSTIAFSITLATIGLTVNVREVQRVRLSPLIVAYVGWLSSLIIFLALVFSGVRLV